MIKRNILITGGELFNKGAQSMTFITVDEMKTRFPNHEIILISERDYKRTKQDKERYKFKIMYDVFKPLFGYGLYGKIKNIDRDKVENIEKTLSNTDIIIDISGYALGSNWNIGATLYYILKLKTAKRFGIKMFLMPQSFGPFDYNTITRPFINNSINKALVHASCIYAREKEGFQLLQEKFKLKNIKLSPDLVLCNKETNLKNIYNVEPCIRDINIEKSSVAIIPNMRNFEYKNQDELVSVYIKIINKLINLNRKTYLVRHSYEDIKACKLIKQQFQNNKDVILLMDDYSCLEYDLMVEKFDYIIASRYHSIVHAYRKGIPCIALGWATKYHELLELFDQKKYIFDVREEIDYDTLFKTIDNINGNHVEESKTIKIHFDQINKTDIFSSIHL